MDRTATTPARSLAGWDVSSDSQGRPLLLHEAQGLHPFACGPALLASTSHPALLSDCFFFHSADLCPVFHLSRAPLSSLLPPISVSPALCRILASHHLGQKGFRSP